MDATIEKFSKHLFWDVEKRELAIDKHRKFIVQRVLGHGQMQDWRLLLQCYSLESIVNTAQGLKSLDPKSLAFIACIGNTPRETFRCYIAKPSSQTHWIP